MFTGSTQPRQQVVEELKDIAEAILHIGQYVDGLETAVNTSSNSSCS